RRRADVRTYRERRRGPRARVRWRAVRRAWRRYGPQPVHAKDVRTGALRGVPNGQTNVRSRQHFESWENRGCGPIDCEPEIRGRLPNIESPDTLRLLRLWRSGRRGVDVQRPGGLSEEARRVDVPVVHGDA